VKKSTYSITELAKEFGLTTRSIRFYEDQGLLSPRREGRNRVYNNRDRVRLKLTVRGKRLGFQLSQIKELFDLYDSAQDETAQISQLLAILADRRARLEQQREDIQAMLAEIVAFENQCRRVLDEGHSHPPRGALIINGD
jgi:DNA-binding transcriptional MerR regulator